MWTLLKLKQYNTIEYGRAFNAFYTWKIQKAHKNIQTFHFFLFTNIILNIAYIIIKYKLQDSLLNTSPNC